MINTRAPDGANKQKQKLQKNKWNCEIQSHSTAQFAISSKG